MKSVYWAIQLDGSHVEKSLLLENNESIPEPGGLEILLRIKACGISEPDVELLQELGQSWERLPCGVHIAGVVTKVGSSSTRFTVGDDVVGVLPLDSSYPGCAEYCIVNEYNLVSKPQKVSYRDAVSCIGEGVRMYSALRYQAHLCGGETVLIMNAGQPAGFVGAQLAQRWGAKVIAASSTEQERSILENMKPELAHVVDLRGNKQFSILNECMEDTGGLGVDCIVDDGVNMYPNEYEDSNQTKEAKRVQALPAKHEIISTLAIGGRWVTSQRDLQLDPPDSKLLQVKSATLCFLNDNTWTLASHKQGKFLHVLRDILQKLEHGTLKPPAMESVSLEDLPAKYASLRSANPCTKVVVEMN